MAIKHVGLDWVQDLHPTDAGAELFFPPVSLEMAIKHAVLGRFRLGSCLAYDRCGYGAIFPSRGSPKPNPVIFILFLQTQWVAETRQVHV
jgi:hypothetical protein